MGCAEVNEVLLFEEDLDVDDAADDVMDDTAAFWMPDPVVAAERPSWSEDPEALEAGMRMGLPMDSRSPSVVVESTLLASSASSSEPPLSSPSSPAR